MKSKAYQERLVELGLIEGVEPGLEAGHLEGTWSVRTDNYHQQIVTTSKCGAGHDNIDTTISPQTSQTWTWRIQDRGSTLIIENGINGVFDASYHGNTVTLFFRGRVDGTEAPSVDNKKVISKRMHQS